MNRHQTAMVRLLRQVEYRERRAKLVWSSRYRLVVVGFMLLLYGLLVRLDLVPLHAAPLVLGAIGLLVGLLADALFRLGWWRELFTYLVLLLDMAGITVMAYYSGGLHSPFVPFYLLQVVASSVYGSARLSATMALLAILCHGLLGGALASGLLRPVPLAGVALVAPATVAALWLGFSGAVWLVWLSSGFFAGRLRVKETELERLHHRLDRRITEIQTLSRISDAVGSTLRLDQLLERLRAILRRDLPLDCFRLYRLGEDGGLFLLLADPEGAPSAIEGGLLPAAARRRDPGWLLEPDEFHRLFGERPISKTLLLPLQSEANPLGLLVVGRTEPLPDLANDLDFYRAIAGQVGVGLERTRVYERTEADSQTCGLTGLYNYRFFSGRLADELARARRYGRPLGLLLLDLDHFKRFNDSFGHVEGDYLLQEIAGLLRKAVRSEKGDIAARHGGEEFALILPEADAPTCLLVAERLRAAIEQARYRITPRLAEQRMRISASIGVATAIDGEGAGELIARADAAMYRAKAAGRNRVCAAE